jgi:hypothetical protein
MACWNSLFDQARGAFAQQRTAERARTLALSVLTCLGRRTLSGLLCTAGQQFRDWSAAYRLFERERLDSAALWPVPLHSVLQALPLDKPVVALLDDTLLRKRGRRIAGTSWRRDPLGPHFADNFIWASRFLQISLALPEHPAALASAARAIPIDLEHAPSPRKPSRRADAQQWQDWRMASAACAISRRGAERLAHLRNAIDQSANGSSRSLLVCADATFTNRTVLRDLPPRTILVGRIRKDARLYALPTAAEENPGRGRRRCYGQLLPTPEQWRRQESLPWQSVRAFAAGNFHDFQIKCIAPLRWKHAGGERQLKLLIVRPIAYRRRQGAHLDYRNPAYLICTDPSLSAEQILQSYLWRWEIELNFRDEKTLLGFGQPQVRSGRAVRTTATFFVFAYALLLLALENCHLAHSPLPRPRWQRPRLRRSYSRITTPQAICLLRADLWASALHLPNKNGLATLHHYTTKPFLIHNSLQSAVLYASG